MPSFQDEMAKSNTEILREDCPQCGFGEAICSGVRFGGDSPRFKTCPRCGCSEESNGERSRRWKGYGVYVLQSQPGIVKAGAFPRAIPDHKVPHLIARFLELGPLVQYVTRWNEQENRVEVLFGSERPA